MSPSAAPATQKEVPRLPRETKVDVAKCHTCHVKRRQMSPSAAPATQKGRGATPPKRVTRASPVPKVPGLPRETKVETKLYVTKLYVTKLCVTKLYVTKLCDKVVCDQVVCDKVVCDKVVCDKVVCDKVVCV